VQDRGLAAYIAELVGTFFLVLVICMVYVLFQATGGQAQFGSDFAVIGLACAFSLFVLIQTLAGVSGAHLNPAVTFAATMLKRIDPVDAIVYVLAQLSGAVLAALMVKGLLLDEGQASAYGALQISPLLSGDFAGAVCEALGTFLLVLAVVAVALNPRAWREWGALSIGLAFGVGTFIFGPLTGAGFNPARWFGPALIGEEWGGVWPYLVGPLVGAALAALFYRFVIQAGEVVTDAEGDAVAVVEKSPGT
jgi:MIP family channel proteins